MTRRVWLWLAAVAVTLASAVWQRRTGPSHPYRLVLPREGRRVAVALPRSHPTTAAARIAVPAPAAGGTGVLYWRRYPTRTPFTAVAMRRDGATLAAALPLEPAAGKVEYYVQLQGGADPERIPPDAGATVVLRYHGPVPLGVLALHIAVMFAAILVGVRAGLAAWLEPAAFRVLAFVTLAALTLGGFVLGPITQQYAFGAYWTGVPFGWDLTDNKTLVMWLGWAIAAAAVALRRGSARRLVIAAALVMLAVYLVPHSLRGSQLDYTALPPAGATR